MNTRKESHRCIIAAFSIIYFILINKNPSAATVNGASKKFMLVETPDSNKTPDFVVVEKTHGKKSLLKVEGETGNNKNAQRRGECAGDLVYSDCHSPCEPRDFCGGKGPKGCTTVCKPACGCPRGLIRSFQNSTTCIKKSECSQNKLHNSGPLKCLRKDKSGNGTVVQTYGICPLADKSCSFSVEGNQTDYNYGGCFKVDGNICFLETRKHGNMFLPYVNCFCNSDGCNKYCTWTDCKNSTRTHFPEGVNPDRKQDVQECTAKCWPNFL